MAYQRDPKNTLPAKAEQQSAELTLAQMSRYKELHTTIRHGIWGAVVAFIAVVICITVANISYQPTIWSILGQALALGGIPSLLTYRNILKFRKIVQRLTARQAEAEKLIDKDRESSERNPDGTSPLDD
jgi:hypothetical protein